MALLSNSQPKTMVGKCAVTSRATARPRSDIVTGPRSSCMSWRCSETVWLLVDMTTPHRSLRGNCLFGLLTRANGSSPEQLFCEPGVLSAPVLLRRKSTILHQGALTPMESRHVAGQSDNLSVAARRNCRAPVHGRAAPHRRPVVDGTQFGAGGGGLRAWGTFFTAACRPGASSAGSKASPHPRSHLPRQSNPHSARLHCL